MAATQMVSLKLAASGGPMARHTHANTATLHYRAVIMLKRWYRRSRELLLQERAYGIGQRVRLQEAWDEYRAWQAWQRGRWHKHRSAELHRWGGLLRLVHAVWCSWRALHQATLKRHAASLELQTGRLCDKCMQGWMRYMRSRWRKRQALLLCAETLQKMCLEHWAIWLQHRRAKRSPNQRLVAHSRQRALRRAHGLWRWASSRSLATVQLYGYAASWSAATLLEDSLAGWQRYCARTVRATLLGRRAYLFMASSLLSRIFAGWNGLCLSRAALLSFEPRAATRLLLLRVRNYLRQWQDISVDRVSAKQHAHESALAVERAGARVVLHSLVALAARRRRRQLTLAAAAESVRLARVRRRWGGWSRALEARVTHQERGLLQESALRCGAGGGGRSSAGVAYDTVAVGSISHPALSSKAYQCVCVRALCAFSARRWRVVPQVVQPLPQPPQLTSHHSVRAHSCCMMHTLPCAGSCDAPVAFRASIFSLLFAHLQSRSISE